MNIEENREFLNQFQALQQQFQLILVQKENVKLQLIETEKALEEITKDDVKEAYKIVGQIMIRKPAAEIEKELNERVGDSELRLKTLEKTEERIIKRLKEMEPKLKKMIRQ